MTLTDLWQAILGSGAAAIFGGISGGLVSGWVSWTMLRAETARRLLADALQIQSEMEAWILDGSDYSASKLVRGQKLPTHPADGGLWLRPVEVRAILDEADWTPLEEQLFDFIDGRRAWIVRAEVRGKSAHSGGLRDGWHPALASSRALENLAGWVGQVAVAFNGRLLRKHDLTLLRPLLLPLCTPDRIKVLGDRLTEDAKKFLASYAKSA